MNDVLQGQQNYKSYSFFFDRFVPLLEKINSKMKATETDEDLLSISSEAFGLLLLENHWDRWLDIYQKCGGKIGDINGKAKGSGYNNTAQIYRRWIKEW